MLIRNPQAPRGLFDGIVFDGSLAGVHRGSTYYHDASGLGNNGTLANMDPATDWVWSPELDRWALDFDGPNDNVQRTAMLVGAAAATLSFWAYRASTSHIAVAGNANAPNRFSVLWYSDAKVYFQAENGLPSYPNCALAGIGWHHLALVFDGSLSGWARVVGYVDGVQQVLSTVGINNNEPQATLGASTLFCLGADNHSGSAYRYATGKIASPLLFSRALTPPEISWLASPANHLRVPPRRTVWPVASAGPTFNPAWAARCNNLIGAGI